MITGVVGLRVMGIWGEGGKCVLQNNIWWFRTPWKDRKIESNNRSWDMDWVLTYFGQLTEINNIFF